MKKSFHIPNSQFLIAVVGGGAAGIMSAIRAAESGAQVTLFEKMPQVGRKLRITGKGRCNLTNAADVPEIVKNIPGNGKFLYSALKNFSSADAVNFFESLGIKTKIERGGRIFPVSDDATEVIDALLKRMAILNVEVKTNSPVTEILTENKKIVGVKVGGKIFHCDAVILATGGASYSATGSTGDGFKFARRLGHTVTEILPALVPLETEEDFVKDLQGLSLRNVRVKLLAEGKKVAEQFGEMLFTHFGVSGPIILTLSRQAAKLLAEKKFVELEINLKPALTPEQLDARILRDFDKFKRKTIKNSLIELLPTKLIPPVLDLSYLDENKKVDEITQAERRRLAEILRGLPLTITKTRPIDEAIVTAGGVSVKEIDPRTMQSKIIDGLFIVGEVADVDGFTGGFNLQAAWAMGNAAGISIT
ncbi:MAG: NAD(P)/FAD-dependent oxidoreductase [Selenomonadaceae bacterium]|nr:NAD(P)/FAD-dependent oxidoreductase [Selenomonadaceae bacterium]